jgi:hypothetical protein
MRISLVVIIALFCFSTNAQEEVNISMNEGYSEDVYVSLANGELAVVDALDWHIAFDVRSTFSVAIRINDGQGVQLSGYPNGDILDWDNVDTTGFAAWPKLNNAINSWDNGAFNSTSSGDASDFSWGYYTGDPLHDVVGDSIYVVVLPEGGARKLKIDILDGGIWSFTHANIDGTDEVSKTVDMASFTERNFVYYNIDSEEFIDREPVVSTWDLVFTKYFANTQFGPGGTAGCLANQNVEIIVASGVDVETVDYSDYSWVVDNVGAIGNDWKFLNDAFQWEVVADQCYFVKTTNGDVFKIIFTSFEGSGTGNISYNVELVSGTGVNEVEKNQSLVIYPNPMSSNSRLSVLLSHLKGGVATIEICNSLGQIVLSEQRTVFPGKNTMQLECPKAGPGMYFISVMTDAVKSSQAIVIQ